MISDLQLVCLGMSSTPGIGTKTFQRIFDFLQKNDLTVFDFWNGNESFLVDTQLAEHQIANFLEHRKNFIFEKKRKELGDKHIQLVTFFDECYPDLLTHIPDFPPVLYLQGTLKKLEMPIAVVGTRKMTSYGKMVTRTFTRDLVRSGCEIISGFMYGVDTFAHESALEFGGYTVGILGYGFDHVYPNRESQRKLKDRFLNEGGALLSEYEPSIVPNPGLFPERNRIVAGMSKGVLVTEAASKSGSKITANLATEYGRDVFAVPGPITSPYSEGTKDLINQGAKLVTSTRDIMDEYHLHSTQNGTTESATKLMDQLDDEVEKNIVMGLLSNQLTSDELCQEVKLDSQSLLSRLSILELKGIISVERGKYSLVGR